MKVGKKSACLFLVAWLLAEIVHAEPGSGIPTCQDVLDTKDMPAMEKELIEYRHIAFSVAAKHQAKVLNDALIAKGVTSPLPPVLDQYETRFMPARDSAERVWTQVVKSKGGTKNAFQALCPNRTSDVIAFYTGLYDITLKKFDEEREAQ